MRLDHKNQLLGQRQAHRKMAAGLFQTKSSLFHLCEKKKSIAVFGMWSLATYVTSHSHSKTSVPSLLLFQDEHVQDERVVTLPATPE